MSTPTDTVEWTISRLTRERDRAQRQLKMCREQSATRIRAALTDSVLEKIQEKAVADLTATTGEDETAWDRAFYGAWREGIVSAITGERE